MSDKSISEVFSAELAKSGDAPTPVSKDELKEWMEKNNGLSEKKAEAAVENATTPAKDALTVALDGRDDEPPKIPEGYNGGGSDDEKADKDGLVYITRTFTIDPAKYRSANYMPKDMYGKPIPVPKEAANPNEETAISDISLDKETVADNGEVETVEEEKETTTFDERSLCYDEGELYGEYEKGDVPVMDTRRAPTRETCETDITQCRAANPLFCRFHGPKLIEADIKKSLRLSGLAGCRVGVTRDATSDNPRAFKLTVACRPEQRERAEEAIDAFLREPGVTPTGERAYENGKLSNYYEMDLERVDRPPRANREPKAAAALRRNQTTPQGTIRGNGQEPRAAAQPRRRPRRPTLADFQPASQPPESQPVQNEAQQQTQPPQQETPSPQQNAQPQEQQEQNRLGLRDAVYAFREIAETPMLNGLSEPQAASLLRTLVSGQDWPQDPDAQHHFRFGNINMSRREAASRIIDALAGVADPDESVTNTRNALRRVVDLPRADAQPPAAPAQQNGEPQMPSRAEIEAAARDLQTYLGTDEAGAFGRLNTILTGGGLPRDPDQGVGPMNISRRETARGMHAALSRVTHEAVSNALRRIVDMPRGAQQPQQQQQNSELPPYTEAELDDVVQRIANRYNVPAAQIRANADSYLHGNNLSQLRNMQQYMRDVGIGEDHPVARHVEAMIAGVQRAEADRHHNGLPMPNKPQSVRKPTDTITQDELNSIRAENESFWQGANFDEVKHKILNAISTVCSTEEVSSQDDSLLQQTMGISRQSTPLENPLASQELYQSHGCNCWKTVASAILRLRGFRVKARTEREASPVFAGTMAESGNQRLTFAVSQEAMSQHYEQLTLSEEDANTLLNAVQKAADRGTYNEQLAAHRQITHRVSEKIEEMLKGKINLDGTCNPPYPDGTLISSWNGSHCTLGLVYKGKMLMANPFFGDELTPNTIVSSVSGGIRQCLDTGMIKYSVDYYRMRKAANPRFKFDVRDENQAEQKSHVMTFMRVQRKLRMQNPNVTDAEVLKAIPLDKDWQRINGSYIVRPDQPLIKEMVGLAKPHTITPL